MTWTKLGDDYADRLEDLELTPTACWLHTAALIYCNRVGSDGRVHFSKLSKIASIDAVDDYAAELERQGLWSRIDGEPAWQIDWTDQEPAEDVKRRRDGAAERQRRRRQHLAGDHSLCDPQRSCRLAVTRDSEPGRTVPVTRDYMRESHRESRLPVPTPPARPAPEGAGKGRRCEHGNPLASDGAGCAECAARAAELYLAEHPDEAPRPRVHVGGHSEEAAS